MYRIISVSEWNRLNTGCWRYGLLRACGAGLAFDVHGNLLISTGCDTSPQSNSGYGAFDTRTARPLAQYAYRMEGSSQGRGISALVAINEFVFIAQVGNNPSQRPLKERRIYEANRGKVDRGFPIEGEVFTISYQPGVGSTLTPPGGAPIVVEDNPRMAAAVAAAVGDLVRPVDGHLHLLPGAERRVEVHERASADEHDRLLARSMLFLEALCLARVPRLTGIHGLACATPQNVRSTSGS